MPRATWKGFIRLSLVSVPVKGYTASSTSKSQISLNQLHEECHSRIRYKKTCPIHGEVSNDEIVSGYEYAKDQYVVIDPSELDMIRSESDRSVNIERFVPPSQIDPVYYSGKTYYLTPDGRAGQKPYALLHRAMQEADVYGLAQVVISNREQLVLLRPIDGLLGISVLHYADMLKSPASFEDELGDADVSAEELKLAKLLIDATVEEEAHLDEYKDIYNDRLNELIQSKIAGEEIVAAPAEAAPSVINLMDALKASVQQAKPAKKAASKKKMAASSRSRAKAKTAKKKKSG